MKDIFLRYSEGAYKIAIGETNSIEGKQTAP